MGDLKEAMVYFVQNLGTIYNNCEGKYICSLMPLNHSF